MIRNNIRLAIRLLFKHKNIAVVNIIGLSISLACALFILLWVQHELSYDRFHPDYKQIHRVEHDQYYSNQEPFHVNVTPVPAGPVWKAEIPDIIDQCRIGWAWGVMLTHGENKFFEEKAITADSSFFNIFGFKIIEGDALTALNNPQSIVISESIAKKYFGEENPFGKTLKINNDKYFTVTAVIQDPPKNTEIPADVVLSWDYQAGTQYYSDNWSNNSIFTFVKLAKQTSDTAVNTKITQVAHQHKDSENMDFEVNPLHRIHLHSYFGFGKSPGAILFVYILSAVAIFVLIIACINFMNMSTAKSSLRAREIGLRKMNGASRARLARQYLSEAIIQTFVSVIIGFLIVALFLNTFNHITGKDIALVDLFKLNYIAGILAVGLITGLIAGLYPAIYLASYSPMKAIRSQLNANSNSGLLRKALVVFQFSLAVLLIAGTIIIKRQMAYVQDADLGFDKYHLIDISLRGGVNEHYKTLKEEFLKDPSISYITGSMNPAHQINSSSSGISWPGKDEEQDVLVNFCGVGYDFSEAMGIHINKGRGFSKEYNGDLYRHDTLANFMINQTLAGIMNISDLPGTKITFMGIHGQVVGVMDDYHFSTLRTEVAPLAVIPVTPEYMNNMIVRLKTEELKPAIKSMQEKWTEIAPEYPFEYHFVDEEIAKMYQSEQRMSSIISMFTFVAIIIACLGLFALSSFMAERKTREVGIRKTYGAMDRNIIQIMMKEISILVLISLAIGLPALWFIANRWLNEFAYRISLTADIFLIAAMILVIVSLSTILYHSVRSARMNPVKALRYE